MPQALLPAARMEQANFSQAQMQGADLSGARLERANFFGAQMDNAILNGSQSGFADFSDARMVGATLDGAQIENANFFGAQMQEAELRGALLQRAELGSANLDWAVLREAQLAGASLWQTSMNGVDLGGADLRGVTGLTQEQLENAVGDSNTLLPVDPPLLVYTCWKDPPTELEFLRERVEWIPDMYGGGEEVFPIQWLCDSDTPRHLTGTPCPSSLAREDCLAWWFDESLKERI